MPKHNARIGSPPSNSKRKIQMAVIDFVYAHLSEWRNEQEYSSEISETSLNASLSNYLDQASRRENKPFSFQREHPQGKRYAVDMAAHPYGDLISSTLYPSRDDEIVVFEAKRLPTPGSGRKKEYVSSGNKQQSGGIQRFKAKAHGEQHNLAAMIGYIQKNTPIFFLQEINKWILELCKSQADGLAWAKEEKLIEFKENKDGTTRAVSRHPRVDSPPITLHHLWVNMKLDDIP